uniref:TonB-dependent receptor domain-containing protein n=1 Tax=Azospirillum argentinense TaxID=2970906 RepID=UPI001FFFEB5F|nr:TonB-dependent receptor [Azospirillum argentinense]
MVQRYHVPHRAGRPAVVTWTGGVSVAWPVGEGAGGRERRAAAGEVRLHPDGVGPRGVLRRKRAARRAGTHRQRLAWASWAFLPGWEARAGVQYIGKAYADVANTVTRPAYTVVNASLDYLPTDNTKLSLRSFNLFDEVYAVTSGTTSWMLGQPRSAELAFSMTF